jgi:hypothetical protein
MVLDYFAELDWDDSRAIGRTKEYLDVSFVHIDLRSIPIQLMDREGLDYSESTLKVGGSIQLPKDRGLSVKWALSEKFPFTMFKVSQFRQAYVLARRIAHTIEDEMCLQAALAPCYGIVQTFDVRVAVPKEILNYESFRRSILIRRT